MSKERRLGRGLEALLGRPAESTDEKAVTSPASSSQDTPATFGVVRAEENPSLVRDESGQAWLAVDAIVPNPYQPRQNFDEAEIADLCDSLRSHGFLQPIVVRQEGDQYQIIAGERRFRAAQLANHERVPVQIREVEDRQMAELAIVENVQRKDLNALEKAASFQQYLQQYQCTQEELASRVHIDRSTVANLIRLLELPETVKRMLSEGLISQGHARALLPLGDEAEQCQFAEKICKESLTVRATEQLVHDFVHRADSDTLSVIDSEGNVRSTPSRAGSSPHVAQLEDQLRLMLGTRVELRQTAKKKGRLTIHFKNNEEFERIRTILSRGVEGALDAG